MAASSPCNGSIGKIVPFLLIVTGLLDFAARFFSIDALTFRSWEALIRFPAPCGLFRAAARYDNRSSYGDLAAVANLPRYRQYRHEIFSTDALGFRRNPKHDNAPFDARVMTVGDSFVFGLGLNDEQTLAARLEDSLGITVYNGAAGTQPATLAEILRVARLLKLKQATILYQYYQEHDLPENHEFASASAAVTVEACQSWQQQIRIWRDGLVNVSPLRIVAQQAYKKLENDSLLPNTLKSRAVVKTLANGAPMLFSQGDIKMSRLERPVSVEGFQRLAQELDKNGLRLVVLLVPTKYTVYRPILLDDDAGESQTEPYLDGLERALKQTNIPVINLFSLFRQRAAEHLHKDEYIYWRDDMHWNARGVELAVGEIAKQRELFLAGPSRLGAAAR